MELASPSLVALATSSSPLQSIDVSELAKISGVPRATVIRKVKVWHDQGMVEIHKSKGRTYVMPSRVGATNENSMWLWSSYERIFRNVARNLSKTDSE